jgi:hypothetical protein
MSQQQIDESSCVRILYHRVAYAVPGADITQIQRVELKDGTVLFIGGIDGAVQADIPTPSYLHCGTFESRRRLFEEPRQPRILVFAPWAFIAYKDGQIIDTDECKRRIIKQWVLETLEKENEDACRPFPRPN